MDPPLSAGFEVVRLVGNTLQKVARIAEDRVQYEKMQISGDYLYVTAHSHGIRVFSLQDPSSPQRVGSLEEGFVDAFAIDIAGDIAYVADGGGGLKIVDVSDPTHPVLIGCETLETAVGTSEDIRVGDGRVFVAAGGAGLAVYDRGDLSSRQMLRVGGAAEGLTWAGDFLVVSTLSGFQVLDVSGTGLPEIVAGEISARRDTGAILRICSGVGATDDGRILSGNWNYSGRERSRTATTCRECRCASTNPWTGCWIWRGGRRVSRAIRTTRSTRAR